MYFNLESILSYCECDRLYRKKLDERKDYFIVPIALYVKEKPH